MNLDNTFIVNDNGKLLELFVNKLNRAGITHFVSGSPAVSYGLSARYVGFRTKDRGYSQSHIMKPFIGCKELTLKDFK